MQELLKLNLVTKTFCARASLSPVLLCGILLLLRFPGLNSLALLGSGTKPSRLFLSFSFTCARPFSFSLYLLFSLSLCFFDFFLDLLLQDGGGLFSWGPSRTVCPGEDVPMLGAVSIVEPENSEGGWLSLSDAVVSWESQSLPLWLESLLTSDSASKGRGMSSTGSCWKLDVMPPSDIETATPACAPPASPLPLEELSLPLTGAVAALLARCDILGFLFTRGSMKSAAGRFWKIAVLVAECKTTRANKIGLSFGGPVSVQRRGSSKSSWMEKATY